MDGQTTFNPAVTTGAQAEAEARLANYFAAPDGDTLQAARAALQRLCGELRTARRDGVAAFCTEVDTVLGELTPELGMTPLHREVLQRAWAALEGYLDGLEQGADDAALRLFPQYQELQQLRGMEMAFEQDLFYPDLEVQLPPAVLEGVPPGDAAVRLKAARGQYQRGLLQWLKQEDGTAALQSMRQAVAAAMRCVPQERRAFWWVAQGLLECMELHGLPPELDARRLLGRIDQQLRAAVQGQDGEEQQLLREMLCLIGRGRPAGSMAREIRRVYALARYLPEGSAGAPTQEVLDDMRDQVRCAEDSWERFVRGDAVAAVEFAACAGQLAAQAGLLAGDGLQELARQLRDCSQHLDAPDGARQLALEVAMALLLLEQGIAQERGRDFDDQAHILSARLQAKLDGLPEDNQRLAQLVGLHVRMERDDAAMPLVQEMLANLKQVKVLPAVERSASQRQLAQVSGGLRMLGQDNAAELALAVRNGLAAPGEVAVQALVAGLDALEGCLQRLAQGQAPDEAVLRSALGGLAGLTPAAAAPVAMTPRPAGEEQELLDVFLEEAREVLEDMGVNLARLRSQPGDREPLAIVRRGFHTLKGSGRMVGLNELGEVAWSVERALNHWLQDDKPATPGLLDFIEAASRVFAGWVEELEREGTAHIDAGQLLASAARTERGLEPEAALPRAPVKAPPPAIEAPAVRLQAVREPADLTQSTMLYEVASEEAKDHARALRQQFAAFVASQTVSPEFAYAAHAYAEASRALGGEAAVDLAAALESWLRTRGDGPAELGAARVELLEQAVAALGEMAQAMSERKVLPFRPELVSRLLQPDATPEAAAPAAAQSQEMPAMHEVRDDVDAQLLPVFLEEADDLTQKIDVVLRAWHEAPDDERHVQAIKRLLHTLKGSARMAGAMRIGEIVHSMEDRAGAEMDVRSDAAFWEALNGDFDRIAELLQELHTRQAVSGRRAEDRNGRRAGDRVPEFGVEQLLSGNLLRVRAELVDRLVAEAGEIGVARARAETELRALREELTELSGSVARMRKFLRELEIESESRMQARTSSEGGQFDPLELDRFSRLQELSRFMSESMHDVQAVQQSLRKSVDESLAAMTAQAHLGRELQQNLMSVRMVPFGSIAERLYRTVRQTAKELNKRANLELAGGGVELDRGMLERMTAPFEHLLRNAIVHGLESEAVRIRRGKPPIGEIRLGLRQENNEVVFEFADDGAGLNFAALREKALARGLLRPDEAAGDERLAQLIFVSGLSTAGEVSEIAGRGVGLDVVRSEIASLGGRIEVHSESGLGTLFAIHLPLTLAVAQTLLVRAGETCYAIPSSMVEQVRQVRPAELAQLYAEHRVEWQGRDYPLHYLPRLLGDAGRKPESQPHNAVLLLRSGEQCLALHVDELKDSHEAVMKNVGPQLARLPWVAGATVLGNGAAALVLNPARLLQRRGMEFRGASEVPQTRPLVMVVDDSLTVRKVTSRLLERAGYQVATAKDGVDALEQLAELNPAVMLLDIEMPRMDGFELTRQLRREPATQNLPIVMITSRAADKHRDHALGLGVNAYLGKPYGEEELLRLISGYISAPALG